MTIRKLIGKLWHCSAVWRLPALVVLVFHGLAAGQDFNFTTNTGSVTITRYTGPGGAVSIPPVINGLTVTSIGDSAFGFSYNVTNITIPTTITNIGQIAFISCTGLTNILIPASVIGIGPLSFKNCRNLAAITVDTNDPAFSGADGVLFDKNQATLVQYPQGKTSGSYAVPGSVQTIGGGAFFACTALTNIALPAALMDIEGAAFYGCTNLAGVAIPNDLTNVGTQAFLNCESLNNVVLPDSVTNLGLQAFFNCEGLTNVTVGNGVAGIGDDAFANCFNLASVTMGGGVTTIGNFAFEYCTALTSLTLGGNVTNLGDGAFSYCFDLTGITLPKGLTTIGSQAFLYCSSLPALNLPASMTNFGDRVCEFCLSLAAITVDPGNPAFASVDGVLFDQRNARLVQYPINRTQAGYTVPEGTTSFADTAFVSAYYLTSVTIPASVTNLETLAFYNCPEVTVFFFKGNPPGLGNNVFDLDAAATVYYLAGTTNWGSTYGGLPAVLWKPQIQTSPGALAFQPFGFTITAAPNTPLVVEASTNLANNSWMVVQTAVLTNGSFSFGDPQWTNFPGRYYRIRSP